MLPSRSKVNQRRNARGLAILLACVSCGASADDALKTGDSTITRGGADFTLHVPQPADEPHGPLPMLVLFGGYGDAADYYQKTLAPIADSLDCILVLPHLPWFQEPGKADEEQVLAALDTLKAELESRFHSDPKLVIVSGASKGGPIACELAHRWSESACLLVLHSTYFCPTKNSARVLHVVGENEVPLLGREGRSGKVLGVGRKDLYAAPKAEHGAHIRPMQLWLETELAALRLERIAETLASVEKLAGDGKHAEARQMLQSSQAAATVLSETLPADDDFATYQNSRRKELREKYRVEIERLETVQKGMR